jgi:hypothetical protein
MTQSARAVAVKPYFRRNDGERTRLALWADHEYTSAKQVLQRKRKFTIN